MVLTILIAGRLHRGAATGKEQNHEHLITYSATFTWFTTVYSSTDRSRRCISEGVPTAVGRMSKVQRATVSRAGRP